MTNLESVCCDFSPYDDRLLAVGYQVKGKPYGAIAIWEPERPNAPKTLVYTRIQVSAVRFFPKGKTVIAVGFIDGSTNLYDFRDEVIKFDD